MVASVARAGIRAAPAVGETQGRWGGTAAARSELPLGARTSFQVEARAFRFEAVTLRWQLVEPAAGPFSDLLKEGVARIDPITFEPTFYQATAGIAIRF